MFPLPDRASSTGQMFPLPDRAGAVLGSPQNARFGHCGEDSGMPTARSILEAEVRELVRRHGLDPAVEQPAVARLIDEAVADYQDRATTSALPPLGDTGDTARALLDSIAGFGPLQPFLDDPSIEEIWINEPGRVFVARRGRSELTTLILSAAELAELV